MWKSGTFDLEDINAALIDEIVFLTFLIREWEIPGV